jgi:dienelactone hydrolase
MANNDKVKLVGAGLRSCAQRAMWRSRSGLLSMAELLSVTVLSACTATPLLPYTAETPPLVLVPASEAGVQDKRARFREIFCAVLNARGTELPDYRPCDEALARVGAEPAGTGAKVDLGPSRRRLIAAVVPGVGWDCFSDWLEPKATAAAHVRQFGYEQILLDVDGLSSSESNARQIRDAIMQMPPQGGEPRLVLIGYSKGAPDILEAVVAYPEIRERVAAVVSVSGAVGGSPLANDAEQSQLALLKHWPGAHCSPGDGGAIESLRPATRKAWLAQNPLPNDFPYYSLVTFPQPERISSVLKSSYKKLSQVDARNDSQVLFYDQVIPGGVLAAYLNADHWAVVVPVARSHEWLGSTFVNHNDFPREALLEALLRFVEEDLALSAR